ncbi:MAG: hypothetical protein HY782_21110 [Chloroflexi bacterium]|nr:hypothetical protein [Chloroflexota bacterium]
MADEFMAYCVKEKAQKPMKDGHEVILKNGKHAMQGVCASCGTKMMKFISSKKPTPAATAAPVADPSSEPTTTPPAPPSPPPAPSA